MTTKLCPNCHNHIASFNDECPICHADLRNVSIEPQSDFNSMPQNDNQQSSTTVVSVKKSKKPLIIGICVAVVLAVVAFLTVQIINNHLSTEGKQAVQYAKKIKNSLKSPKSLEFYDDILYIEYKNNSDEHFDLYYFDITAANSYGASVRSQFVYVNGDQYNLNEDEPDIDDYRTTDEYFEEVEKYLNILTARIALNEYKIFGDDGSTVIRHEVIPAKKIFNKI